MELDESEDGDEDPRSSGASPRKPQERDLPQPTFRDRRRINEHAMLASMNATAKAFWAKR
jgi:hypothetical protein